MKRQRYYPFDMKVERQKSECTLLGETFVQRSFNKELWAHDLIKFDDQGKHKPAKNWMFYPTDDDTKRSLDFLVVGTNRLEAYVSILPLSSPKTVKSG